MILYSGQRNLAAVNGRVTARTEHAYVMKRQFPFYLPLLAGTAGETSRLRSSSVRLEEFLAAQQ